MLGLLSLNTYECVFIKSEGKKNQTNNVTFFVTKNLENAAIIQNGRTESMNIQNQTRTLQIGQQVRNKKKT
jgi:hypothetical protein